MRALDTTFLTELRAGVGTGDLALARQLLAELGDTTGTVGAELHTELGRLAEHLGELEVAITEYNLALRDEPTRLAPLHRLAQLRADRGELRQAERAYRRLRELRPHDSELILEWGGVLEELGEGERARELYQQAVSASAAPDPHLAQAARRLGRVPRGSDDLDLGPDEGADLVDGEPGQDFPEPGDADLITFASLFSGREGVHARQWASATGRHGYTPVHEPFTPAVARAHLLGAYTVGIYPVRMDQTARFLAFDLDVARYALSQAGKAPRGLEACLAQTLRVGRRLVDAAAAQGLTALLESSGYKGYHVWLLCATPVPASALRRLGGILLHEAGPLPPEVTVEVFPKQSRVAAGSLGNLIKLPLGVHRVTGRRSLLVDGSGQPLPDPFARLRSLELIARAQIVSLRGRAEGTSPGTGSRMEHGGSGPFVMQRPAGRESLEGDPAIPETGRVVPFPAARRGGSEPWPGSASRRPASTQSLPGLDPELAETLTAQEAFARPVEDPYEPEEDVELQWLAQRCPVLGELLRRAEIDSVISNDARLVLTYTVGHLATGPQAVNSLLSRTLTMDPTAFLKSRLRGHPMSCPKIRARLPEITAAVCCDCHFEEGAGLYPTPLLHLQSLPGRRGSGGSLAVGRSGLQVERLVTDLYRLRADIARSERLARDLEGRLRDLLTEQGVEELVTSAGTLRLQSDREGALCLVLPGVPGSRKETVPGSRKVTDPGSRKETDPGDGAEPGRPGK